MKKFLIILCLVLLSSYSYSKEILLDQLVERDGVYYEVNSTTPFTGSVGLYENGQLEKKGNYKDGKLNGIFKIFNEKGKLEQSLNYKDGELDGLTEFFNEKGKLKESRNYKDGKQVGLTELFNEKGKLTQRGNWKNGKPEGLFEWFDENGKLSSRGNFIDGEKEGLFEWFDEKGKLTQSGNLKNGKRDGITFFYKWDIESVGYYIDGKNTRRRQYFKKRPNDKKSWDEFCSGYHDGYLMGGLGTPGIGSVFCPDQPRKLSNISDYDHGHSIGEEQGNLDMFDSYLDSFDY